MGRVRGVLSGPPQILLPNLSVLILVPLHNMETICLVPTALSALQWKDLVTRVLRSGPSCTNTPSLLHHFQFPRKRWKPCYRAEGWEG